MGKIPNTRQRSNDGISFLGVVIFVAALGVSALILNLWGNHVVVRALVGIAWGGYCLFSFGPDLLRLLKGRERKNKLSLLK